MLGFSSLRLMVQQSLFGPRAARARGVTWSRPEAEEPGPEHAETLKAFLETGAVVPQIEASYPFERLPEAMEHIMTGHARAKIVVVL